MILKKKMYKCYQTWNRKKHPQLTKSIYEKSTTYNILSSEMLKLFPKVWEADKDVYFHHSCLIFYWSFNWYTKAREKKLKMIRWERKK